MGFHRLETREGYIHGSWTNLHLTKVMHMSIDMAIAVARLRRCRPVLLSSHVVVLSLADMGPASHVRKCEREGSGMAHPDCSSSSFICH